jgi:hypothetical protein
LPSFIKEKRIEIGVFHKGFRMNLTEVVKTAIGQAESELSEKELRDHKKLRTSTLDILRWMQAQKVGFLAPKPRESEFLPEELKEYLESDLCSEREILIPYGWQVEAKGLKEQDEINRNFWHIVNVSMTKGVPMKTPAQSTGLGSPNTWERGKD